jgi:hypothetical protein
MQARHRIPSIFNLSMVDVLCCALGVVLLLWLLNTREARDRAEEAGQTAEQLALSEAQLTATRQELAAASKDLELVRAQLSTLMRTTAVLTADLDRSRDLAAANQKRYETAEEQSRSTAMLLEEAKKQQEALRLSRTEVEKKLMATALKADDLVGRLGEMQTRINQLKTTADLVPELRDELKSYREKFLTEQAMAQALEKTLKQRLQELAGRDRDLEDQKTARRLLEQSLAGRDKELARISQSVIVLEGEKKTLLNDLNRARVAVENRFAGINLTGRRVLFMVDKSGSMGLLDAETQAADKWPAVRQTVVKIMRSLPELEKFQVITFAQEATYLLGQDSRWIDYDPRISPDRVLQGLADTEPRGGTNLHAAFDAAFRFRSQGLDTIYLISDGLPDRGITLPANSQNWSPVERADYLSKHLRRELKTDWNREVAGQPRVRINCVGFFYESPDVGAFLWALARENDGSFVGMSKP